MAKRKSEKQTNKQKKVVVTKEQPKKEKSNGCATIIFLLAIFFFARTIFGSQDASDNATARPKTDRVAHTQAPISTPSDLAPIVVVKATNEAEGTATRAAALAERAENNSVVLGQITSTPTLTPVVLPTTAQATPRPTLTSTIFSTSVRPTQKPTQAPAEIWYTAANARVRSCPSTSCEILTVIETGTRVEVIGQEEGSTVNGSNVWFLVKAGGQIAYLHRSTVSQTRPVVSSPVPQQPVEQNQQQSQPQQQQVQPPTPVPQQPPPADNGPTALCKDGTYSYSAHRRGTCSHHGGVDQWLKTVPP